MTWTPIHLQQATQCCMRLSPRKKSSPPLPWARSNGKRVVPAALTSTEERVYTPGQAAHAGRRYEVRGAPVPLDGHAVLDAEKGVEHRAASSWQKQKLHALTHYNTKRARCPSESDSGVRSDVERCTGERWRRLPQHRCMHMRRVGNNIDVCGAHRTVDDEQNAKPQADLLQEELRLGGILMACASGISSGSATPLSHFSLARIMAHANWMT